MPGSVIVSFARTPIGKLSGAFTPLTAMDLGGHAIQGALERGGVGPEQVDYVVMGHVLQAGQGQITARQAAARSWLFAAASSISSRVRPPKSPTYCSVPEPMWTASNAHHKPSLMSESITSLLPMR
jgi:homogentisate 1,2-dioxygenase